MKKLFVVLPLVAVLVGCSGMSTLKTEDNKKQQVPSWYLEYQDSDSKATAWYKPWDRKDYVYAVAEDVSPSMEMAVRKATIKAKTKLVDRVKGELTNRTIIQYSEGSNAQAPVGTSRAQDTFVNVIAESVVNNYNLEKKEVLYNTKHRNFRAFVMLRVSAEDMETMLLEYQNSKTAKSAPRAQESLDQTANSLLNSVRQ